MPVAQVAVCHEPQLRYTGQPPFDPPNPVYEAVCTLLRALGLDAAHGGTAAWNPFGGMVRPGGRVVIKPNLVTSRDFHRDLNDDELSCSSTHASVLRPLLDLAVRAVGPSGSVAVLDCPLEGSDFDRTARALGVTDMIGALERSLGRPIPLLDLREFRLGRKMIIDDLRVGGRSFNFGLLYPIALSGDPLGSAVVDLGTDSVFTDYAAPARRLRFHRSHKRTPVRHHRNGRNEYSIANSALAADLVINVPKMKTHKKAGATLSMKSVIGLSPKKYWLPHYTAGAPPRGDEYAESPPLAARIAEQLSRFPLPGGCSAVVRAPKLTARGEGNTGGSWSRNDTIWRTVVDLNRILLYADRAGALQPTPQRRVFTVVDGIVAGEGEGPLAASPKHCGVLIGGENLVAVDTVACEVMGIDPLAIRYLSGAEHLARFALTNGERIERIRVGGTMPRFSFQLPQGWDEPGAAIAERAVARG